MKSKVLIFLGVLISVILIIIAILFIKKENEENNHLTIYGNVDIRQADLGFRVFGKVDRLYFDEGDSVKVNDLLAELEKTPYVEELSIAKAKVVELENSYRKSKAQFKKRYLTNPEAISKEEYDNAFYNLKEMKAALNGAKSSFDRALTNLEDTKLYSSENGVILTRINEPGTILNPGQPVFTVSIANPVWIRAFVSEQNLGKIYFGMPAKIYTDTEGLKSFNGHIGFISPVAEFTPKTVESLDLRTDLVYRLRVYVDDPNKFLKQGMPVTVKFDLSKDRE